MIPDNLDSIKTACNMYGYSLKKYLGYRLRFNATDRLPIDLDYRHSTFSIGQTDPELHYVDITKLVRFLDCVSGFTETRLKWEVIGPKTIRCLDLDNGIQIDHNLYLRSDRVINPLVLDIK